MIATAQTDRQIARRHLDAVSSHASRGATR